MRTDYLQLMPPGGTPPADAVEVYLPAPVSFSLAVDGMSRRGAEFEAMWQRARQLYIDSGLQALRDLQRGMSGHSSWPRVQLQLAVEVHSQVPGVEIARLHHHVYVGAVVANPDAAGGREPLNRRFLDQVKDRLFGDHTRFLRTQSETEFGFEWRRGEIVQPPLAELVDQYPVTRDAACPGVHGPGRVRLYADDERQALRLRRREMDARRRRRAS